MDPTWCLREEFVTELIKILDSASVVHVRGTPASGKTTLAYLLRNRLRDAGRKVVFVPTWPLGPYGSDYGAVLVDHAAKLKFELNREDIASYDDVVFIIDEAQMTYVHFNFWQGFIKQRSGTSFGTKVCLFTSYGSPAQGPEDYPTSSAPVHISLRQCVGITPSPVRDGVQFGLYYNADEFEDLLERLNEHSTKPLPLSAEAKSYLFSMTNGHPGAVNGMINFLQRAFKTWIMTNGDQLITKDMFTNELDDDEKVFHYLESSPVWRSFPPQNISLAAANVLCRVLTQRRIPRDLSDVGIRECFRMGWLHSEMINPYAGTDMVCFYPSLLHYKYAEYYFGMRERQPFPYDRYPDLRSLCIAVVKNFSRKDLCDSNNLRYNTGGVTVTPPEAQFQAEFYAAAKKLLGDRIAISSEWSTNCEGRIDLRISNTGWGIELLRDGDRLTEHCSRFEPGGKYHDAIQSGELKDWLIIDCTLRRKTRRFTAIQGAKLIRVVFAEDYASAEILDVNNAVIAPMFRLPR